MQRFNHYYYLNMFETVNVFNYMFYIIVVIILLSVIELYIAKHLSILSFSIPKTQLTIQPILNINKHPIYIYNSSKIKRGQLNYSIGYNENEYTKHKINEHIGSKICNSTKDVVSCMFNIHKSKTPIDSLYNLLGKSDDVINTVNPSLNNKNNLRVLIHNDDNIYKLIHINDNIYIL